MELRSLSATAASVYELCPARYKHEFTDRHSSASGDAANLGTACHYAFQTWVEAEYHRYPPPNPSSTINKLFDAKYDQLFSDERRRREGHTLCQKWLKRQDWTGRTVLSTEHKVNFELRTSIGPVPFNYIRDRVDLHDDGDVEVIDYKSVVMPVSADELRNRVQSRCYALATWLEHPTARRIWVTFDLLRYEPIGIVFTAEECEATLRYLENLAERIIADPEAPEVLNDQCRFCARKGECATLNSFAETVHSVPAMLTPEDLLANRARLDYAKSAITALLGEYDDEIRRVIEASDDESLEAGNYVASLTAPRRRVVDVERLSALLPPDEFAKLASVNVGGVDDLLRDGALEPSLASQIRQTMVWRHGTPTVKVKRASEARPFA